MKKCEIVAIIPARWSSNRLVGKSLRLIAGKPMVQRVYERTAQCSDLSRVIVATDDQRIFDCVKQFGGDVVLSDGDFATGSDRVAGVAKQLKLRDDTIILNVQGDQPRVHPKSLSSLIQDFTNSANPNDEMGTLGFMMPYDKANESATVKIVLDVHGYALYFSRHCIPYGRDEPLEELLIHLGIYIYSYKFLKCFSRLPPGRLEDLEKLEQLRLLEHGYKIKVLMSEYDSPEVDTLEDCDRIETLFQSEK